jgi:hypothetical protein
MLAGVAARDALPVKRLQPGAEPEDRIEDPAGDDDCWPRLAPP